MLPRTISITELVWSLVTIAGFGIALVALLDAHGDLQALRMAGKNGARRIVAIGNIRREVFRVALQAIFSGIGIYLMTQPPANAAKPITRGAIVLTVGMVAAALSIVASSSLDRRERIRLIAYIDKHYTDKEQTDNGKR